MPEKGLRGPLFLLSPAKALDMAVSPADAAKGFSQPRLLEHTETLVQVRCLVVGLLAAQCTVPARSSSPRQKGRAEPPSTPAAPRTGQPPITDALPVLLSPPRSTSRRSRPRRSRS